MRPFTAPPRTTKNRLSPNPNPDKAQRRKTSANSNQIALPPSAPGPPRLRRHCYRLSQPLYVFSLGRPAFLTDDLKTPI
ncbi:hypothetical protein BCEP4_650040 [Burkholderia cepacia]|nr:hypothetical protein BCEP4_650040 [Burkholderia cepacia]